MAIRKRKIFYISGFDPRGAGHYHKLYKAEAQKQAELIGVQIKVGNRRKVADDACWDVEYKKDDVQVHSEYTFLKWDDIIRRNWEKRPLRMLLLSLRTYYYYIFDGTFKKALFTSWPPALSLIYPLILILLIFAVSGLAASWIYSVTTSFWLAALCAGLFMYVGSKIMEKLNAYWLLRLYIFYGHHARQNKPDLEVRIYRFVETLNRAIEKDDCDEVLLASHSAGTIPCISLLARLKEQHPDLDLGKLKVLTIGHCIPLLSFVAAADSFREELKTVAKLDVEWLDVTAPSDGVCFALNGPFIGVCESENPKLKVISARFHKMFEEKEYKKLKRNRYLTHFLYLMAADKKNDFDYFQITAGEVSLEDRFSHLETAIGGYKKFKLGSKK